MARNQFVYIPDTRRRELTHRVQAKFKPIPETKPNDIAEAEVQIKWLNEELAAALVFPPSRERAIRIHNLQGRLGELNRALRRFESLASRPPKVSMVAVYQLLLEAEAFFKDREDYEDALDDLEAIFPYLTKVD